MFLCFVSLQCCFVEIDKATVLSSAVDNHDRARLLAAMAPHSGDWLHALPISSCGLQLDDEAVRVAVGLRLGTNLCQPHQCPCGALVDARGTHGLACRRSAGRSARHSHINDIIWRALKRVGVQLKNPLDSLEQMVRDLMVYSDSVAKRQKPHMGCYHRRHLGCFASASHICHSRRRR